MIFVRNIKEEGQGDAPGLADVLPRLSQPIALLDTRARLQSCTESFLFEGGVPIAQPDRIDLASLFDPADRKRLHAFCARGGGRGGGGGGGEDMRLKLPYLGRNKRLMVATFTRLERDAQFLGLVCQVAPHPTSEDPRLRAIMEDLGLGVWDFDTRTGKITVSRAWLDIRGSAERQEVLYSRSEWLANVHPDDRKMMWALYQEQIQDAQKHIVVQFRYRHAQGHWIWILSRASVMETDDDGRPLRIVGTDTDVSNVKAKESEMLELTGKFHLAIAASGMGIWEFDTGTGQVHWDDRILEIYGIEDGLNQRPHQMWEQFIHPDDRAAAVQYGAQLQRGGEDLKHDFRIVRPDGTVRHLRTLARNVHVPNGQPKLIGVNIDMTEDYLRTQELEMARRQLEHDSRHDMLTGLGNRRKCDEAAAALFAHIAADQTYAVMQIDLDFFKQVNDTFGHAAGDHVLKTSARVLQACVGRKGQVFRMGGDEFTVLIAAAADRAALDALAHTIVSRLGAPVEFEGQSCPIGATLGYAIGKGPPDKHSDVFINADVALYAAKNAGRGCVRPYREAMTAQSGSAVQAAGARVPVQSDGAKAALYSAMDAQQITCFFQPIYDAQSLAIVSAEALVRWAHPSRGVLTPDMFLPQAIRSGQMAELDSYVLHHVLARQDAWAAAGIAFPPISVNVSYEQMTSRDWLAQTQAALQPHHRLSFELLETAFIDRIDTDLRYGLDGLRELGIGLEMDDFGAGHASVVALQALKPDRVKIDRNLVTPLAGKPDQILTLQALCNIARLEGAKIIVEGLETGIHLAAIRQLDCDALQGYALQRPVPDLDFAALLTRRSKSA